MAAGATDRWPWFSRISVPGLRHQVIRHAGLAGYDARTPGDLQPRLRTPAWSALLDAADRFPSLGPAPRALVVFQLVQLSYCRFAIDLAGPVTPTGEPGHDRYVYEVARAQARGPGHAHRAVPLFARLAAVATDPTLALAARFQAIGQSLRQGRGPAAAPFADGVPSPAALGDDWHTRLVRSRFHRAVALLRLAEGRAADARTETRTATVLHDTLVDGAPADVGHLLIRENERYLLELRLRAAGPAASAALGDRLLALDPYSVQARLTAGDAHAAAGDAARAASCYEAAGELGTGAGALGWFRAAQARDALGDRPAAIHAMGRCLELDATAVEPRAYLAAAAKGDPS